ncbi:serine/threonine-protein phosphatase 2A regulatory subunit B'' subunit gamma-like [Vanessa tameamea]|uniref:Serine/threonine-protein phosphatase 2A regulatory subunit B'' subunit gamma-like n=1 Tax=Vanessa tameamea TaxID=334116 RepID=A0A8B8ITM6_VANTA|nr:serine/threonine-protein phosphatase 2A regulatory subunit B'' subunit gamma-like [Vanessa tameamea]XP_047540125.1 serine/threonine-protein phosphatase 2A regulatory subunit B'' subunit gamma-like [Vanessa atalanta]
MSTNKENKSVETITSDLLETNIVINEEQKRVNEMLKNRLRKYIKKLDEKNMCTSKEESEKTELETFKQLYKPKLEGDEETYKKIPKFYFKLPRADDVLAQKLREETRAQFLQKKSKELLDNSELKHLWSLLEKSNGSYSMANSDELTVDYLQFKKIRDEAGPKYRPYFTAEVFGRLQAAEGGIGRVRGVSLFNYVMRRVWLQQTRIGLSLYDVSGQGYLTEHDLESYIAELVPSLAALDGLDSSFTSFYVCTAARKFLFFLDPLRVGRVRIRDVLSCSFLDDLLELREEDLPMELQEQNWFSAASALRVYGQYLNLDRDHNGMLSINELAGYGSGTLTRAFLARVFQQCLTYDGEMDYKTYLDLVLALENRRQPAALAYLFRVLDINSQGFLDAFTLNYFFKAIQEQMVAHGAEPVNFDDVKDEIFDMIRPEHPSRITLQDLIKSGHGHTAVSILLELHGFWAYENREALAAAGDHS